MLFDFEKVTATATQQALDEEEYTISDQVADMAIYTLEGGDITVRYDGSQESGGTLLKSGARILTLDNREAIKGFRFVLASGTPILNIQYISLEWPDLKTLFVPRLRHGNKRTTKVTTQTAQLATGAAQRRRTMSRPLAEFDLSSLEIEDGGDNEIHGFFAYHQGDTPFYLHAHNFSTILRPQLVGYGDDAQEDYFIPARFILPNTLKVFLNNIEVDDYAIDLASGLISFFSPPTKGTTITASYARYYKSVFADDTLADSEITTRNNEHLNRKFKTKEIVV